MDILAECFEEEVNVNGQIPAGFLFASVKNTGSSAVTVNGVSLAAGEAKSFPFVGKGYKPIPYEVTGSTLRIMRIV